MSGVTQSCWIIWYTRQTLSPPVLSTDSPVEGSSGDCRPDGAECSEHFTRKVSSVTHAVTNVTHINFAISTTSIDRNDDSVWNVGTGGA